MASPAAQQTLAFRTPIGSCGVRWGPQGVSAVLMPGSPGLRSANPAAAAPPQVRRAAAAIARLLDGERVDLGWVELDESRLDEFRRRVHAAARRVPPGQTTSYGALAREIGDPPAAREVGAALARNPYPIVVPCHRVLSASGELRGFSAPGGIATKRRLLEIEGAPGFEQQPLFS